MKQEVRHDQCVNDGSSYGIQGALRVRSVVLFQASYHRGHPALMELHGELGKRHLTFWSSAQAVSQQKRALQSIVFDVVELTDYQRNRIGTGMRAFNSLDRDRFHPRSVQPRFWTGNLCQLC